MKATRVNKTIIIEETPTTQKKPQLLVKKAPQKVDLKNIIEVTEENQPNPIPSLDQCKEVHEQSPAKQSKFHCFKRYLVCISNIWRMIRRSSPKLELDINDSDFAEVITKIRTKKQHYPPILPHQKQQKKVLVLDLDQTLIHTSFSKPNKYDYESQVVFNGRTTKIYTVKRFGLDSFLFQMSKMYQIIVFTASQRLYADRVIDLIDPKKRISHRLYRDHCIIINKSYYLKNMRILGRNLKDIVIVDDNNIAGLLQPDNFYKIEPFEGNQKDRYLCRLSAFLKHIHDKSQITPIRDERKRFQEMEINLSEEDTASIKHSEGRTLRDRKRMYKHKKTNSEIQALFEKTDQDRESQAETTASDLIRKL